MPGITPEYSLVLGCIPVFAGSEPPERLFDLLRGKIDWDLALQIASWHGVTPILRTVLEKYASDIPSANALSEVHAEFQHV